MMEGSGESDPTEKESYIVDAASVRERE